MIVFVIDVIGMSVLVALFAWGAFSLVKHRVGMNVLASLLLFMVGTPSLHALEVRHSEELVTVAADETIEDTLIVLSESVSVDGTINGDLIAVARRVVVRGTVNGDLITAGQSVSVEGNVTGNVLGFARSLDVSDGLVGRNLYGFGRDVSMNDATEVDANAAVFAQTAELRGNVGIDLIGFAGNLELTGNVGRDVKAFAGSVTLLAPARVEGDLTAYLPSEDALRTASGATVVGTTKTHVSEREESSNRYLSGSFYMLQAVRFGAAFITGLVLMWLFPALRTVSVGKGIEALKTGGIGLLTVIALPVLASIAAITIVGIPMALLGFALWLIGIYVAKIVTAVLFGRLFLEASNRHYAVILLAGLVAVLVAINIPFVGGLLNFVLTILGLGILTEQIIRHLSRDRAAARGASL